MAFILKIVDWVKAFLAGNLGVIQAGIKFVKEVLTLVIDILFPIIPSSKFQGIVLAVRNAVNTVDGWVEKLKAYLIPVSA